MHQKSYIEKMLREHADDSIPSTAQTTRVRADENFAQEVCNALVCEDERDPEVIKKYHRVSSARSSIALPTLVPTCPTPSACYAVPWLSPLPSCIKLLYGYCIISIELATSD